MCIMPANKNAMTRYKFLDELLSDNHHFYDIHDLTNLCNEKLEEYGYETVGQRTIEKDLNYIEFGPLKGYLERFNHNGKSCIRYENRSFSIFTKELTDEESHLLYEVLDTIGQFDGLASFEWLDNMKIGLGLKERRKIISFSFNPYLKNSNLLGSLFDAISNEQPIELSYHIFNNHDVRKIVLHPYLLKQYNNRWFLIGAADSDGFILNFALDRIDSYIALPDKKYKACSDDLEERFEDIVGVTLPKDSTTEHIVFWVSDEEAPYIETKPIHGSQTSIKNDTAYRVKYPDFSESGRFFSLDCIVNYELKRELMSFFDGLVVLEPANLRADLQLKIISMNEKYNKLRT